MAEPPVHVNFYSGNYDQTRIKYLCGLGNFFIFQIFFCYLNVSDPNITKSAVTDLFCYRD